MEDINMQKKMVVEDMGVVSYEETWMYQKHLFDQNIKSKQENLPTSNILLICEHPHVITIGKNGKEQNLLFSENYLQDKGVSLFRVDRGGDVTYHGPGQLVVYPIFDLEYLGIGLRQYIFMLEEIMIRLLRLHNVEAFRSKGETGVWLDVGNPEKMRKIGAIGVRSSRYITMHGLALNVNTDLSYYSFINPCGFTDRGVTSLMEETGRSVDMFAVKKEVKILFEELFLS